MRNEWRGHENVSLAMKLVALSPRSASQQSHLAEVFVHGVGEDVDGLFKSPWRPRAGLQLLEAVHATAR